MKIKTFIWSIALIFILTLYFSGIQINQKYFQIIPTVVILCYFLWHLFDIWLWKIKLLHSWFVSTPNISGTWKGIINSDYSCPKSNQKKSSIESYLIIRQTHTSIEIKLLTEESCSNLIGSSFFKHCGSFNLVGVYRNEPKQEYRDRSPIHYGGLSMEVHTNKIITLEGNYWTSRKTTGYFSFTKHRKDLCSNFLDCKTNFDS